MTLATTQAPRRGANPIATRLVLTVNRATYDVVPLPAEAGTGRRAVRLIKADGKIYDLAETGHGPECDCPDFIFRRDGLDPTGCKHVRALIQHGLIAPRPPRAVDVRVGPRENRPVRSH